MITNKQSVKGDAILVILVNMVIFGFLMSCDDGTKDRETVSKVTQFEAKKVAEEQVKLLLKATTIKFPWGLNEIEFSKIENGFTLVSYVDFNFDNNNEGGKRMQYTCDVFVKNGVIRCENLSLSKIVAKKQPRNNKKEVKKTETVKVESTENVEKIFIELMTLYLELLEFKDKSDFKKYGFNPREKYYDWLAKVGKLKENPDSKLLFQKKGVVVGDLEQLGLSYSSSRGGETKVTKVLNNYFSQALTAKPIEKIETTSGISNYEQLKLEYELFGKWKITNTIVQQSYRYEIYKKGNQYIGIIPSGDFKIDILEKRGTKYLIKGNKFGEYFIINSNMEMKTFDKDGDLASVGYVTAKE